VNNLLRYIKNLFYYVIIDNLFDFLFYNIFKESNKFTIIIDHWTIGTFVVSILDGLVLIGILKLISLKLNTYIYKSQKFIIFLFIIYNNIGGLEILLTSPVRKKYLSSFQFLYVVSLIYLLISLILIYYYWKYRLEITIGIVITNFIISFTKLDHLDKTDFLDIIIKNNFGIEYISNFNKGLIMLGFLIITITIPIYLRKIGVYDYRSRKEKWQEKVGKDLYARNNNT
jgi:hypothetical protein